VSRRVLLQLQPDRFHYNWRRLEPSDLYPRFEALAPEFFRWYGLWTAFIDQAGLGELHVQSAELTYVNQIPAGDGWRDLSEIGAIVPAFKELLKMRPRPTAGGVQAISDAPDCRVQIDARTAKTVTEPVRDLLQIDITAHSKQSVTTSAQLPDWFARANSQIVDSFLSATATKAQEELWQRVRE
jgi:uncharacterized protein (TIGR04255 family)